MQDRRIGVSVTDAGRVARHDRGRAVQADSSTAALEAAQRLFYTSKFSAAADQALQLVTQTPSDLAAFELRISALHFQIRRRASGNGKDRKAAMAACKACPALLEVFLAEIKRGRAAARQRLAEAPHDEQAMYYLAKIDTSYLFLQLSTLGKRTGWDEYWEAKRLLETVLQKNPGHLRAQVAQAWMDYIIGTSVPWGTRWVMGGGSRNRGLRQMRAAAAASSDFYSEVEAEFALWEMLMRDGKRDEAVPVARELLVRFPERGTGQVHRRFVVTGEGSRLRTGSRWPATSSPPPNSCPFAGGTTASSARTRTRKRWPSRGPCLARAVVEAARGRSTPECRSGRSRMAEPP